MCHLQIRAGLVWSYLRLVQSYPLPCLMTLKQSFYPTLASLWDREKSILPRYVLPRPLSMLHDCLFRPSLLFCEGLETLFWG